eukprot:Skav209795  [mRNA]  locus=scaffold1201:192510:194167:- [translate_table: standard]
MLGQGDLRAMERGREMNLSSIQKLRHTALAQKQCLPTSARENIRTKKVKRPLKLTDATSQDLTRASPAASLDLPRAMAEDIMDDEAVPALKLPEGDPPSPPTGPSPRSQTHRSSDASCRDSFTDVMEQIQVLQERLCEIHEQEVQSDKLRPNLSSKSKRRNSTAKQLVVKDFLGT